MDVLAPASIDSPLAVCNVYEPLWKALRPETVQKVTFSNYERKFGSQQGTCFFWWRAYGVELAPPVFRRIHKIDGRLIDRRPSTARSRGKSVGRSFKPLI
jgi:hypothetical protein